MLSSLVSHRYNPSRRPDWRLDRVLGMVSRLQGGPGRCTQRDDVYVKGLRNFILRYRGAADDRAKEILVSENPGLFFAYHIYENRNEPDGRYSATMLEARLLAGQDDKEIAHEICTIPEAVEWYEALFFNVRDRMTSSDWIVSHVLMPSVTASSRRAASQAESVAAILAPLPLSRLAEPFFDATVKFFAYFGGKFVLDYVISGFRRGDLSRSRDEVSIWFDNHTNQRLRHRSAVASSVFEVTQENVMQLFAIHTRLIEIANSGATAENNQDQQHRIIRALLDEIPWAVGSGGGKLVAGTAIQKYDESAIELRDDELQHLSVGEKPDTIDGMHLLTMPKARVKPAAANSVTEKFVE